MNNDKQQQQHVKEIEARRLFYFFVGVLVIMRSITIKKGGERERERGSVTYSQVCFIITSPDDRAPMYV